MDRKRLRKIFLTPPGHIVYFGGVFFVSGTVALLNQAYQERWLSWSSGTRIAGEFFLGGIVVGILSWYLVTLPVIKRLEKR